MGITMEHEYSDALQQVNAVLKPKPVGRPKKSGTKRPKIKVNKENTTEISAADLGTVELVEPKELVVEETSVKTVEPIAAPTAVSSGTLEEHVRKATEKGDLIVHIQGGQDVNDATAETAVDEDEDCDKNYNPDETLDEYDDDNDDDNDDAPSIVANAT